MLKFERGTKENPEANWNFAGSRENYIDSLIQIEAGGMKDYSLFDSLTEVEKKDIIEVDGHRYIRKIYESRQGGVK